MLSCTQLASLVGFLSKLEGIPNYYFPELNFFGGVRRCRQTADLEGPWAGLRPKIKDFAMGRWLCTQLASLVGFLSKLEGIPNYYFPELNFFGGVRRCRQTADLEGPWAGLRPQTKDIADGTLAMHNG